MPLSRTAIAARMGAVLLMGVFFVNVYLGLYDTNLSQFQVLHYYLNFAIAAVTLVASLILFARPKNTLWLSLAGIVWPVLYVASLAVNVESRLCLGTGTNCFATVNDSYQYLILNSPSAGWKLFPFTIPLAITLLVATVGLSTFGIYSLKTKTKNNQEQVKVKISPITSSHSLALMDSTQLDRSRDTGPERIENSSTERHRRIPKSQIRNFHRNVHSNSEESGTRAGKGSSAQRGL